MLKTSSSVKRGLEITYQRLIDSRSRSWDDSIKFGGTMSAFTSAGLVEMSSNNIFFPKTRVSFDFLTPRPERRLKK